MQAHQNGAAVLIIGGGPFGLTLSMEFSRCGIRSLLVDAKARTALNPQPSDLILIRPNQIVAWRRKGSYDADAVLDTFSVAPSRRPFRTM